MRAIILSAGQGTRLLPWTARTPKCLLPVQGRKPILELQLRALAACGVRDVQIVVGFGADQVESFLRERPVPRVRVQTLFNPFHRAADNLVSCWLAVRHAREDFVLLNGDTLFEEAALVQLLESSEAPATLAVNHKPEYDADDMRVSLDGRRLRAVGKTLEDHVDAESIGLMVFRGDGPRLLREAMETCLNEPEGLSSYYLSAVDRMARAARVETVSITGRWWQEVDSASDWVQARAALEPVKLGVVPTCTSRARRWRRSAVGLLSLVAALFCLDARPALADDLLPDFEPSAKGERDIWMSGPALRVYPTDGVLRPFVLGGIGASNEVRRLRILDITNRFREAPFAGRVGGGLELQLDPRASLSVDGSYLQRNAVDEEPAGTVGLKFQLKF